VTEPTPTSAIQLMPDQPHATCRRCQSAFPLSTVKSTFTGNPLPVTRTFCDACEASMRMEEARQQEAAQREAASRRIQRALADLAAPAAYAGLALQDVGFWGSPAQQERTGRALQVARRIVGELQSGLRPPPFVAFIGRPGNGKTMLCWAIATELATKGGHSCRVVRLSALIRDLRANWGSTKKSGPSDEQRLKRYIELDYLAIDEVSRDAFYGTLRQHLLDVINARIDERRPTVITSNESLEDLEALLGPALMSRLSLGGVVHFGDDEDFRQLSSDDRQGPAACA
jgi:DNA replication protein DnaC